MKNDISTLSKFVPKRVVSLQPSATVTLHDLGMLKHLVACTKYCVEIVPEVTACAPVIVHDSWSASAQEILAAKPDLVIASVPYQLESVGEILKAGIPLLALAPHSLADVYSDIAIIARVMGAEGCGLQVIAKMQHEIEVVRARTATLL